MIGSEVTSAPVASRIAFAIAAAVGTIGGSPSPFEPRFVRCASGSSTKSQTISGTSAIVGSLYASSVLRQHRPGLRVVQPHLGERVAERLDDPALDLAAGAERVDHAADVVDRDDLLDDDLARADVDRDLGELDAEREHAHPGRVRAARALAEDLAVVEQAGDLLERPRAAVRARRSGRPSGTAAAPRARSAARRARSPAVRRRRRRSVPPGPSTAASTSRPRSRRTGRAPSRRAEPRPGRA